MLVDSHCHLDFDDFKDDFPEILTRAQQAGVQTMVSINTRISNFPELLAIAEAHEAIYCTVGVHPHSAEKEPETEPETLIALADHPKVIAIGETGLDFFYDKSPRDIQETLFRNHIAAARETGLPVIVHTRDADDDCMRILEDEQAKGAFTGLVHCFTAGPELAERALAMGFYISLSGIVTFKNASSITQTIKDLVPMDRILVETDAPYLAPMPHRGKRNEPAFTAHTAKFLASLLGVEYETFATETTNNFYRLFSKAQRVDKRTGVCA
jgi:TatD DNase family protein